MRTTQACAAVDVPSSISAELDGYRWIRIKTGQSGGAVYRLQGKPGFPDLFLKHGSGMIAVDILKEMIRLQWLANRLPVPAIRRFVYAPGDAWLLMIALPGRTACEILRTDPDERFAIVDAIAGFLRQLHTIPIAECPFNSAHDYRLLQGRERIEAGLVDEDDFDEVRKGWTAEKIWTEIHCLLPFTLDQVVTHGDLSLDNILVDNDQAVGCIDVGRLGIADRYQDLAVLWNALGEFGEPLRKRLFSSSGIAIPDRGKLQFHLMLDELF
jgi:aminoglycoside 3'-phosphotransferase I